MSQLTANQIQVFEDVGNNTLPVLAGAKIFRGSAIGITNTGYARQLVAGDPFAGFSTSSADNSGNAGVFQPAATNSSGTLTVSIKPFGVIQASISGLALTDVGAAIYMSDGATFTKTASGNSYVGRVHRFVSSGVGMVRFDSTQPGPILAAITDSTTGTPSTTFAAITGTYATDAPRIANALAQLALMLNGA